MANTIKFALGAIFWLCLLPVRADVEPRVVDIPTRPGVTQRLLVLAPPSPKAAAYSRIGIEAPSSGCGP